MIWYTHENAMGGGGGGGGGPSRFFNTHENATGGGGGGGGGHSRFFNTQRNARCARLSASTRNPLCTGGLRVGASICVSSRPRGRKAGHRDPERINFVQTTAWPRPLGRITKWPLPSTVVYSTNQERRVAAEIQSDVADSDECRPSPFPLSETLPRQLELTLVHAPSRPEGR